MKRSLTGSTAALLLVLTLGAFTPVSSGESRPTLKFAGSTPATGAIEDAFTMALDNLIAINSIPYDPGKWNDTGLMETAAESRFLRAAPSYGDNPWVHDGAYNTWSAMNLIEANDGRATHVARNTLWACCDVMDGKLVVNIRQSAHSEWYMYQLWNIAAWHYYRVTGDAAFLAKAYEAATQVLAKQEAGHFNADYGLFKGSYFVGDGASGFPEPPFEPERHSSNALEYPEVHEAMVLSTNCVLQYRNMTLNVTLKGEGNAIRGVEINGKPAAEPFVPESLQGTQNVTILLGGPAPARTIPKATVVIDTGAPAQEYNPMIFGGFIEHFGKQIYGGFFEPGSSLADKMGFRLDVIEAIKELKVPVIRWPGGCFVDSYHWQKGVGKVRQPYDDDRWGVLEPNTFGTHEFVELCRRLGAEPYICQNSLASIQEMADWVAYCNATTGKFAEMRSMNGHPEPFNVRFWSVGNEKGGRGYIDKVRDTAIAMKQVDPSIIVTCSGSHGPRAHIDPYLFETAGNHLNLLSVHEYWIANYQKHHAPDYLSCMMLSEKPDAHISAVVNSIDGAGMRGRIKIAFDEWNLRSWHHPGFPGHQARKVDYSDPAVAALVKARDKSLDPSLYTMADALFCASFFNACLRHTDDVAMANISCLVNQTGPLYVHPKGIVKRTHFHTMAMYANLLQSRVVGTQVNAGRLTRGTESIAMVDAIATVDESGKKWAVAIINRSPSEEVTCTLQMAGLSIDGTYKATVLTGDSPDSYNDIEHPRRVAPKKMELTFKKGEMNLPPHSLVIVDIQLDKSPLRDEQ